MAERPVDEVICFMEMDVLIMATVPNRTWAAQIGALLLKFEAPDGAQIPWSVIAMWAYRLGLHNGMGFTGSYRAEFSGPKGIKLVVSLT